MKRITLVSAMIVSSLLFSGCPTVPVPQTPEQEAAVTAAMLQFAGMAVGPVLANNPRYVPIVREISETLRTLSTGQVDAAAIALFATQLAQRLGLSQEDAAWANLLLNGAWNIYVLRTGQTSAELIDPKIQAWIHGFKVGLDSALAASGN